MPFWRLNRTAPRDETPGLVEADRYPFSVLQDFFELRGWDDGVAIASRKPQHQKSITKKMPAVAPLGSRQVTSNSLIPASFQSSWI